MRTGVVDWAVQTRHKAGENEGGDRCVVKEVSAGVLVAVIDGIGHGEEAAIAAERAAGIITSHADQSLPALLQRCHSGLFDTRGAVMSLAFLDRKRALTWTGVGNVEGRLIRRSIKYANGSELLLLHNGVLGSDRERLPYYYSRGVALVNGDVLILATDGIRNDFEREVDITLTPEAIAGTIMERCRNLRDDALVFVGKYAG